MYARKITFTLLAPSIWPVVEAVATTNISDDYKRYLMRTNNNAGIIFEVFESKEGAGNKLDALKAIQALHEQAMAKVTVAEGELI